MTPKQLQESALARRDDSDSGLTVRLSDAEDAIRQAVADVQKMCHKECLKTMEMINQFLKAVNSKRPASDKSLSGMLNGAKLCASGIKDLRPHEPVQGPGIEDVGIEWADDKENHGRTKCGSQK